MDTFPQKLGHADAPKGGSLRNYTFAGHPPETSNIELIGFCLLQPSGVSKSTSLSTKKWRKH